MLSEIMYSLSFQLVIKQALIKLSTIDVEYFFPKTNEKAISRIEHFE